MFYYKNKIGTKNLDKEFEIISQKIENLKLPEGFLQFLCFSVSELFSNIQEHAKAKKAFVKIEIKPKSTQIEIADNGIGFFKSYLSKKIYPKDDFSAIEFALSGLSTKELDKRGFGLYTIKEFILALKGKMQIESGKASFFIEKDKIKVKKLSKKKKGVRIILRTPNKKVNFYKLIG